MAIVHIPSLLRPLTGGATNVRAAGATLLDVFDDLDRQYPGLRARILDGGEIRPDVMVAIDSDEISDLTAAVPEESEVHILPAIAGGAGASIPLSPPEDSVADRRVAVSWQFLDYVDDRGVSAIRVWLDALPADRRPVAKAKLDARLRIFQALPDTFDWRGARPLRDPRDGLIEMGIDVSGRRLVVLACHGPSTRDVTLLSGVKLRAGRVMRADREIAKTRMERVRSDAASVCAHDFE